MTVSYQYEVASSTSGGFVRLLFRWRGSVWKLVYREILFFSTSYTILTLLYRYVLTEVQKRSFEKIVYLCSNFMELIPLSFMLGFYVSFTATRWWSQYLAIPWPDKLMNIIAMYMPGLDESSRMMRRTLMRYLNLSLVLVLRSISMAVKRRFPTRDHLVEAGFMTKVELDMFQSVPSTEFNTYWIPCTWFINILRDANKENKISDSNGVKLIMEELNEFRSKCGLLWGYDWISVPLVYTQVVTIATYAFYFACIIGRQYVKTPEKIIQEKFPYDYYFPVFTVLQILFYMGLLKVAEQLINPFGDDDEDFELNWIIDRHMKVSYLGVDTLNGEAPPLVKDSYYDELDVKLPYTEASLNYKKKTYRGSVARMQVPMEQQLLVVPEVVEDEEGQNDLPGMGSRRPSVWTIFGSKLNNSQRPSITSSGMNVQDAIVDAYSDLWKHSTSSFNLSSENIAQSNGDRKNSSGTGGTQDGENGRESSIAGSQDFSEKMSQWESSITSDQGRMPCPIRSRSATCLLKQQPQRNTKPYKSLFKKRKQPSLEQHYMDLCRKWNMKSVTPCRKISEGIELTNDTQQPHPSVQITVSSPPSNGEDQKRRKPLPPCRSTSLNVGDRSQRPRVYERRQSYDVKRSTSSSSVCSQETVMQEFHSMPNVQEEVSEVATQTQDDSSKTQSTDDRKKPVLSQSSRDHKISRQNALRMDSREKQESISSSSDDYKVAPEIPTRSSESPSTSISVTARLSEEKHVESDLPASSKAKPNVQEGSRSRKTGTFKRSPARRGRPSTKDQKRSERKCLPPRQYSSDSPTPYTTETSVSEGSRSSATSTPATSTVVISDVPLTVPTSILTSVVTTPERSSSIPTRQSSSNNRHDHTVINIEQIPPDKRRDRDPVV